MKEEGSQHKFEVEKISEGQEYAPRLKPTAPIRLADRNHTRYPSRQRSILRKRWLDDGLQARAIRSTQESSEDVPRTVSLYIIYIELPQAFFDNMFCSITNQVRTWTTNFTSRLVLFLFVVRFCSSLALHYTQSIENMGLIYITLNLH